MADRSALPSFSRLRGPWARARFFLVNPASGSLTVPSPRLVSRLGLQKVSTAVESAATSLAQVWQPTVHGLNACQCSGALTPGAVGTVNQSLGC